MKRTFILVVLGVSTLMSVGYAAIQRSASTDLAINDNVNAATNAGGVSTSMNGNTSTNSGIGISSSSASAATRNASGSNN